MAKALTITPSLDEEPLTPEEESAVDAEQHGQEPETPETPAPDEAAAAPVPGKEHKAEPKPVPYRRFEEVNQERVQYQREALELREKWARLEERQKLALEAEQRLQQAAQQSKGPQRPDETIDPVGAQLWDRDQKIAQLEAGYAQLQQGLQQTGQTVQQTRELNDFVGWLRDDVSAHERQHPDYSQKAGFIFEHVRNFAKSLGANEQEAEGFLGALQQMATVTARRSGKSPAAALDGLATALGFAAQVADPHTPQPTTTRPSATDIARTKLEQAKKGQAFQGLSRVPNQNEDNTNWSTLTAADLAEMDEEDFMMRMSDPRQKAQIEAAMRRLDLGV